MNWILLIAGDNYYPSADTGDWIGCFPTVDEAKSKVTLENYRVIISGRKYDWYEIVDLRDWVIGDGNEKESRT